MKIEDVFKDERKILGFKNRVALKTAEQGECLIWNGKVDKDGYGCVKIDRRTRYIHRMMALLHYGELPEGCQVMHSCDTPSCFNIAHLSIGDNDKNVKDMIAKQRAFFQKNPEVAAINSQLYSTGTILKAIREYLESGDVSKAANDNGINEPRMRAYLQAAFGSSAAPRGRCGKYRQVVLK